MDLTVEGTGWVKLDSQSVEVTGAGHVQPRLQIGIQANTYSERRHVRILSLNAKLRLQHEVLAYGFLRQGATEVSHYRSPFLVDVPLSREAVAYITDSFREHSPRSF